MITMSQRLGELRAERGMSRPELSLALGFAKNAMEKFETGRQTPSQEQQEKLAAYFAVTLPYLRGETNDRTRMEDWLDVVPSDEPAPAPARVKKPAVPAGVQGSVLDSLLTEKKFQESLRAAVLDVLRSPEGQEIIAKAVHREIVLGK